MKIVIKMKKINFVILTLIISFQFFSQSIYVAKEKGTTITFYSDAPLEKIEAKNTSASPVFNAATGEFQIRVPMQAFIFKNDLMKEHFNENYVESDKFPHCTFKGKLDTLKSFEDGKEIPVSMSGKMDLHGVIKDIRIKGTIKKSGSDLIFNSVFYIKPADYNIKIPTMLTEKIAEEVKVTFNSTLIPYVKK
ncbi:MAG: YceI family protein [Bacteroidia bacterium]|nr:YceI family protein [Bacteroidia bacterium]